MSLTNFTPEASSVDVAPTVDDVRAVTSEVWSTFLTDEFPLLDLDGDAPAPQWSASVTVKGAWNGHVVIALSTPGAHAATTTMLGLPREAEGGEQLSEADVTDAVGELVNMIGGNVKSLLPGPSQLSLPVVATGAFTHGSESHELVRLDLAWGTEPVTVTVHASRAPQEENA